ncbi:hypothetical protein MPER_12087 [Moniliophthora perniciosa FA553]|nr:hypothetical protein MPER_12087 [Moniliophthora perniciosa FA553]
MPPSSLDPKHPLLQKVPYSDAPDSCQELFRLAWRDKNRDALFEKVYDNNGQPAVDPHGVQYTSLKVFFNFDDEPPKRVLVTSEYREARADAERWFGGQDIAEPIFSPEDSEWNRWALPKHARMDLDEIKAKPSSSPKNNSPPPASHQTFIVIGMPGIGQ